MSKVVVTVAYGCRVRAKIYYKAMLLMQTSNNLDLRVLSEDIDGVVSGDVNRPDDYFLIINGSRSKLINNPGSCYHGTSRVFDIVNLYNNFHQFTWLGKFNKLFEGLLEDKVEPDWYMILTTGESITKY